MNTKLNAHALGVSLGGIWALAILLVGFTAIWFGYGVEFVEFWSTLYVGYGATIGGSVIGAVWAFIDAYIGGVLVAWLYNKLSKNKQ